MRTLAEILQAAKMNNSTTHEECLYALLAMDSLSTFDQTDLRDMAGDEQGQEKLWAWSRYDGSFKRWKAALAKSPKDWLGPNNDPANPEVVKRRAAANKLFERIVARES